MGGTLMQLKNKYNWTICCVTQSKKNKAGKMFMNVCREVYGAKPVLLNCCSLREHEVTRKLAKFDHKIVFTHNAMGETYHPRHIRVHDIVKAMRFEKLITFWPYSGARKDLADISIDLTETEKRLKLEIMSRYPLSHSDFEQVRKIIKNRNTERFLIPENKKDSMLYKFYTTQLTDHGFVTRDF